MRAEEFPARAGDAGVLELAQARHVEIFHRAARQHIDLAGFVRDRTRGGVGDYVPIDLVDVGLSLDVVVRILDQTNERTLLPLLEHEGAGTNRRVVGRIGLEIGPFIDVLRNHRQRADLEDADERAERLLQREDDRRLVRSLDLVELHQIAARARMGLLQEIDREQDVCRCERLAVVPGHALHELEGVGLAVLADRPALGEAGQGIQFGAVAQQAFIDVASHHLRRAVLNQAHHQARRLRLDHGIDNAACLRPLGHCRGAQEAHRGEAHQNLTLGHRIPRLKKRVPCALKLSRARSSDRKVGIGTFKHPLEGRPFAIGHAVGFDRVVEAGVLAGRLAGHRCG